jgi:hypothetical protein
MCWRNCNSERIPGSFLSLLAIHLAIIKGQCLGWATKCKDLWMMSKFWDYRLSDIWSFGNARILKLSFDGEIQLVKCIYVVFKDLWMLSKFWDYRLSDTCCFGNARILKLSLDWEIQLVKYIYVVFKRHSVWTASAKIQDHPIRQTHFPQK